MKIHLHDEQFAGAQMKASGKKKPKVYLVVDTLNAPGRVYGVFAEARAALNFRDRYHEEEATVEERTLLYGRQTASVGGYIE